jgi:hypothetical protein
MTSGGRDLMALSIISTGVTQTGQPTMDECDVLCSNSSTPNLTIAWVCPPQTHDVQLCVVR